MAKFKLVLIAGLIKMVDLLCHNLSEEVVMIIKSKRRNYMIVPRVIDTVEKVNRHLSVVKDDPSGSNS